MNPFDDLLEVEHPASGPVYPIAARESRQAIRSQLLAALVNAVDPMAWLEQLSHALDALSLADPQWASLLPSGLGKYNLAIESNASLWRQVLALVLKYQANAHDECLALGSLPASYPVQLRERYRDQCLKRLMQSFGEEPPAQTELDAWHEASATRQQAWRLQQDLLSGPSTDWAQALQPMIEQVRQAQAAEASLQRQEGLLEQAAHDRLFEPQQGDPVQWLAVHADGTVLPGVWGRVAGSDWAAGLQDSPIVLWVQGEGGGMVCLADRQGLLDRLAFTLAVGGLAVNAAAPLEDANLSWVAVQGGLDERVEELLNFWSAQAATGDASARTVPGLTAEQDTQRREHLARAALAIPADTCRQAALAIAEQQWQAQALLAKLPPWILSRSSDERRHYADQLLSYHQAAQRLEKHLQQLPDVDVYSAGLLIERIEADHTLKLTADTAMLYRPKSMTYQWFGEGTELEPPPDVHQVLARTAAQPGMRWVASDDWETMTLKQLALEGFDVEDEAEQQRLQQAQMLVPGLGREYLSQTLASLDPLKHYATEVKRTYDPRTADDPELLRLPYRLDLQLLAKAGRWQNHLTEDGAAMLETASTLDSAAAFNSARLSVHWLTIHSDEELGDSIEGACAVVSMDTGRALLYLPGAPGLNSLIERQTLEAALDKLRLLIKQDVEMARFVALRSSDNPDKLVRYLSEAGVRDYGGYLTAPATLSMSLIDTALAARSNQLINQARLQGRSKVGIQFANQLNAHRRHVSFLRAVLAIIPGVNLPIALQEVHHGALAISAGWQSRDLDQLALGLLSVLGGTLDVLFTVLPVAGSLPSMRQAVRQLALKRAPFAGYESQVRLKGAVPLDKADKGSWRLGNKQYIWQDGRTYEVFRRPDETTLRLRGGSTRTYDAPVRLDGQRWVIHADVGVAGGRLTEAESIFADLGAASNHPRFMAQRRQTLIRRGRAVLRDYRFPSVEMETRFAYALLADGAAPQWAQTYLQGLGAITGSNVSDQALRSLRWHVGESDQVFHSAFGGEVSVLFAGTGTARPGVRILGDYYPVIPGPTAGHIRHILPPGATLHRLRDLDELIGAGLGPIIVRLGDIATSPATVVGRYSERFTTRLARLHPGLSRESVEALGEAIYRKADVVPGLSGRRIRAMDQWLNARQPDPLVHLATREVHGTTHTLAVRNSSTAFEQIRWRLSDTEQSALRAGLGRSNDPAVTTTLQVIVAARGYQVLQTSHIHRRSLLLFKAPGREEIYVLLQSEIMGELSVQGLNGTVLLGDAWLDFVASKARDLTLASSLRSARDAGLLRPLLGGVHIEGPGRTELIWERVRMVVTPGSAPPAARSWREHLRALTAQDHELVTGSGLYGTKGTEVVQAVGIQQRCLPVFATDPGSQILLSRSDALVSPLSFDALERCIRERFTEQPWVVIRYTEGWSVSRTLFPMQLESLVIRTRPGLTPLSARNAARGVFETATGTEHARLLYLEHILGLWQRDSRALSELADPMLGLSRQWPIHLQNGAGWRMALPIEAEGAAQAGLHLMAAPGSFEAVLINGAGQRLQRQALNLIDRQLQRYGWERQYKLGNIAQYYQASTGRIYLTRLQSSLRDVVEVPLLEGQTVLSTAWLEVWLALLPEGPAAALRLARQEDRLIRLLATLRLQEGPHHLQVVVQRLADF